MKTNGVFNPSNIDDEIIISIGRNGDLLFSDGAHRLAIAKLLNIHKIPAKIAVRHKLWIKFRKKHTLFAKEQGGKLYQPGVHIDLLDIPAYHACEDRYLMIKNNMEPKVAIYWI